MRRLGMLLREQRKYLGLGLRELAAAARISPTYLSRVETGKESSPPSEDVLLRLARRLALEPDAVLTAAGRLPADIERWLLSSPKLVPALRGLMELPAGTAVAALQEAQRGAGADG